MSSLSTPGCYRTPLSRDSIRLLRLFPHEDNKAPIECQLFHYSLRELEVRTHPYDALSYAWGDQAEAQSIFIREQSSTSKQSLPVTDNLHAALSRLRYAYLDRFLWIDAVCINQEDNLEKEQQIQIMAKIYGLANRVVVWLGKLADKSDRALQALRDSGNSESGHTLDQDSNQAISALLQRSWFQRIWVLQEVAAARHILIVCGPTEIDGYAFCLGLQSMKGSNQDHVLSLARSVVYLIKGSIFRSDFPQNDLARPTLNICSLGELIDMYLGRKATRLNDKVYALLGMSTDDPSHIAGLLANYGVSWKELLQRLVKYLLGDKIQVETWSNTRELAVIKGKGYVFGIVAQVQTENGENIRQSVKAIFRSGGRSEGELVCWTTQASAKSIQDGDIICFLEGASNPSIIRPCYDYFDIIIIAAKIPGNMVVRDKHSIARDFLLSWDWENLGKIQCQKRYKDLLPKNERLLENSANLQSMLDKATRIWDIALILEEVQEYEKAEEMRAEAIERYEGAFGVESNAMDSQTQYGLTPLSWAARNGHDAVVRELLTKRIPKIDPDLRDNPYGRTPLSRAAEGGYEAVVELLIETGEVDFDSKDTVFRSTQPRWATEERVFGMTPLLWAAGNGHKGVVQLLLETGKVDVNARDRQFGETPLLWAIKNGHEAVVALLLKTGKVNANAKDIRFGRTPLWWAIENGHEALVALLLKTGKVDVNARDPRFGGTPLLWAVQNGQEAVVTLLLKTGKANVDEKGNEGLSPLSRAVQNGDEVIVKLLLDIGKADVNVGSNNLDLTPLQSAAAAGHEVIVKLLLQAGNIKVDAEDQLLRTPLWWAACNGYEKVVKLLLDIGKAEVNTKDRFGVSPIWGAVDRGYMAVVKLLLDTGKANFDRKDWNYRQTTLQRAVETGHGAVIKQLKSAVENSQ